MNHLLNTGLFKKVIYALLASFILVSMAMGRDLDWMDGEPDDYKPSPADLEYESHLNGFLQTTRTAVSDLNKSCPVAVDDNKQIAFREIYKKVYFQYGREYPLADQHGNEIFAKILALLRHTCALIAQGGERTGEISGISITIVGFRPSSRLPVSLEEWDGGTTEKPWQLVIRPFFQYYETYDWDQDFTQTKVLINRLLQI